MTSLPHTADAPHRYIYAAAGFLMLGVAAAGMFLPVVPTTGPTLLALACFTRSFPGLRSWLLQHRRFGPVIQQWEEHRSMPRKAKVTALLMMAGSAAYVGLVATMPLWARALALTFIAVGAFVVARIPTSAVRSENQHQPEPATTDSRHRH
ncbi:MAG: YbaN family protein [Myxococcota bacterium]